MSAPPSPQGGTTSPLAQANIDRATALTEEFIDRGAPWSEKTSWRIVLGESIVAVVVGLVFLLKPLGGVATTLQLIGLALLGGALITAFQIWRHQVHPDREVLAAFRAGSGITVGLVVVVATFFAAVTAEVSASLAVVVGIGFIIFGAGGIGATFVGRSLDEPLPAAGLVANAVLIVAGVVLMFSGAGGPGTVDSVFNLLGILLIVAGVGMGAYAYLLRQQETAGGGFLGRR